MTEYVIRWDGIGTRIVELIRDGTPPYLICKRLRTERVHEGIVRCRDCKHADWDITANWCARNEHYEFTIDDDLNGFCSWGVRRSD